MSAADLAARAAVVDAARRMNASGLNRARAGNVSARVAGAEAFLVTPTGMDYDAIDADDIVEVGFDGRARGSRAPSSEWRFHRAIYEARADAMAIVHAHAPFCTTLACLRRSIPAFHYMVAVAGGADIRCSRKLPRMTDTREVELSGILMLGGSDEEVAVHRDADRCDPEAG